MVALTKRKRVLETLEKLDVLLTECGEDHWRSFAASAKSEPLSEMGRGIEHWFGGMGSFSDLWLSSYNGHDVAEAEEVKVNKQLSKLRSRLYALVTS